MVFPGWLITVLQIILLTYLTYRMVRQSLKLHAFERKARMVAAQGTRLQEAPSLTTTPDQATTTGSKAEEEEAADHGQTADSSAVQREEVSNEQGPVGTNASPDAALVIETGEEASGSKDKEDRVMATSKQLPALRSSPERGKRDLDSASPEWQQAQAPEGETSGAEGSAVSTRLGPRDQSRSQSYDIHLQDTLHAPVSPTTRRSNLRLEFPFLKAGELVVLWGGFLVLQLFKSKHPICSAPFAILYVSCAALHVAWYLAIFQCLKGKMHGKLACMRPHAEEVAWVCAQSVQGVAMVAATGLFITQAVRAHRSQQEAQTMPILYDDEVYSTPKWTVRHLLQNCAIVLLGGVIAGLLGIGGGTFHRHRLFCSPVLICITTGAVGGDSGGVVGPWRAQ